MKKTEVVHPRAEPLDDNDIPTRGIVQTKPLYAINFE